jgi:aryl-alcohol dehydrogenase-like predicted oxidoreductase
MIEGHATKEGTFEYLKQFPTFSKDFYRFSGEYFLSSLGLGTFRKEPYKEENYLLNYKESVQTALLGGINLIDTAINYRYQTSEREIGEAITELVGEGKISRDQFVLTSKAGFIPLDFPFPENPYTWINEHVVEAGLAEQDEVVIDQHCMSPAYLRWSVEQSLKNLQVETLDILFLHNPETQLGYVDREEVMQRIAKAFELFEELVEEGKIRAYGIASWNGFLYGDDHMEYLSLKEMVALAEAAGGKAHHFEYLQAPVNLAKPHALAYSNQAGPDGKYYTLMQAASGYGLKVIGSSSLLQMNLFKAPFAPEVKTLLGTEEFNDVHTALQFARSSGAISALFGAVDPLHVKSNLLLGHLPALRPGDLAPLLQTGESRAL